MSADPWALHQSVKKNELHHTKNCPVISEGISPMAISCDSWDSVVL
jgi:hypothetical protein